MTDRFLREDDIAFMLATSKNIARQILDEHGVHPVDLGAGKFRGRRWLESAVVSVVRQMHASAQEIRSKPRPKSLGPKVSLADMSPKEVFSLTRQEPRQ